MQTPTISASRLTVVYRHRAMVEISDLGIRHLPRVIRVVKEGTGKVTEFAFQRPIIDRRENETLGWEFESAANAKGERASIFLIND